MKTCHKTNHPLPTVDIIIRVREGIVLIKRNNPPAGWALPGGFVDYGETVEAAAIREAKEETQLDIKILRQFHTYSDPRRDSRHHTITTVFVADAEGEPVGADDAQEAAVFTHEKLPEQIAFDHREIIADYYTGRY